MNKESVQYRLMIPGATLFDHLVENMQREVATPYRRSYRLYYNYTCEIIKISTYFIRCRVEIRGIASLFISLFYLIFNHPSNHPINTIYRSPCCV